MLEKTGKHKVALMSRYELLKTDISKRETLIETLTDELGWLDDKIERSKEVIHALDGDLQSLFEEYGEIMRYAFRNNIARTRMYFILSAESFRQAFQRWRFFKRYDSIRRHQVELINWTRQELIDKRNKLILLQTDKSDLIDELNDQKVELGDKLATQNKMLSELQRDEKTLMVELQNQQRRSKELQSAITNLIQRDVNKAKNSRTSSAKSIPNTPEFVKLSGGFRDNKGRLPWPVAKGVITRLFGNQPHPTLKNINIKNNGIDIRTPAGETVRAVFEGTVTGVQEIPGYSNVVILQHGKYYTVYSHLDRTYVSQNQAISAGQTIGTVRTDPRTQHSELHFEIWENKQRLNPGHWLRQK